MKPKYPIFILSKGRADTRLTARTCEAFDLDYYIVIEKSEFADYNKHIDKKHILVLPDNFRENPQWAVPDCNGLLGGSIPVRNFIWDYARYLGVKRFWCWDDNIRHFYRLNRNRKRPVTSPSIIRIAEDFVDRYTNVKMAGFNYAYFAPSNNKRPPYYLNTRVYSCILLSTDVDYKWRGKYNEDTDLSIRILKDGWCTILFNAFLCGKQTTHSMSGGNTEEVYKIGDAAFDNRWEFAESLHNQHPDVVKITQKWGRWHHHVNYTGFTQQLIKDESIDIPKVINNYGMKLTSLTDEEIELNPYLKKMKER